jgi:integrase
MKPALRIAGSGQRALPRKISFTVRSLAALTVPAGRDRIWVYDLRTPRLAFMKTATGATAFYYYAKVNGRPVRYRLGDGTLSIEQARKLATNAMSDIANGINPQAAKQAARAEQTFGDIWTWYYDNHVKPRLRTADELQQKYNKYLKTWAGRKFGSITRSDVAALHTRIGKDRPGAANRLVRLVSSLYNRARDIGFDGVNPAAGVRLFPENKRERYLTAEELPAFYKGLKAVSADMQDVFELALYTGARISNIRSMAWSEVNSDSATWVIPAEKFKTGKPVAVPLATQAMKILKRRQAAQRTEPADFVFPSRSASGYIEEHKRAWETVCKKGGLKDLHCHDLRHSLATWQKAMGTDLSTIGRGLGHASPATTARYAHVQLPAVRASMAGAVDAIVKAMQKTSKKKVTK